MQRHLPGGQRCIPLIYIAFICFYSQELIVYSDTVPSTLIGSAEARRPPHRHRGRVALGRYETERRNNEAVPSIQPINGSDSTVAESSRLVSSEHDDVFATRSKDDWNQTPISVRAPTLQEMGVSVATHAEWPRRHLSQDIKVLRRKRFQIPFPTLSSLLPKRTSTKATPMTMSGGTRDIFSVQLDSTWTMSTGKWISVLLAAGRILGSAAARILLPMTITHRLIAAGTTAGQDWYTGYYIRTTLQRMEQQYTRRYQVPACLRSLGRLVTHWSTLYALGLVMEWMVGLSHPPCQVRGGCSWGCGMLWIVAVIGPGHLFGVAVAIWVRGLRIQVDTKSHKHDTTTADQYQQRPSGRRIMTRPFALLRWMMDPGQWFREIIARDRSTDSVLKPFDPDWLMFPATWRSLRVLQMIAVAKEMHGSNAILRALMRLVILQQAFGDEWYRVLMIEKRVAWSIILMVGYMGSTLGLVWTMLQKPAHSVSSLSILFTVPSLLAVAISGWMNVLVYFDRRQHIRPTNKEKDPVQEAIQQYKRVTVPLPRDHV